MEWEQLFGKLLVALLAAVFAALNGSAFALEQRLSIERGEEEDSSEINRKQLRTEKSSTEEQQTTTKKASKRNATINQNKRESDYIEFEWLKRGKR